MANQQPKKNKELPTEIPLEELYWLPVTRPRSYQQGGPITATVAPYVRAAYIRRLLDEFLPGWGLMFLVISDSPDRAAVKATIRLADGRIFEGIGEARRIPRAESKDKQTSESEEVPAEWDAGKRELVKAAETDAVKRAARYIFPHLMDRLYDEDGRWTAEFRPWPVGRGFDMVSAPVYHKPRSWRPENGQGEDAGAQPEPTEPQTQPSGAHPRRSGNSTTDKKAELVASFDGMRYWPPQFTDQRTIVKQWTGKIISKRSDLVRLPLEDLQHIKERLAAREGEQDERAPWPTEEDVPPARNAQLSM